MSEKKPERSKTNSKLINLTLIMAMVTLLSLVIAVLAIITPLILNKINNGSKETEEIVPKETEVIEEGRLYTQEEVNEIIENSSIAAAAAAREEVKQEIRESYQSGQSLINSLRSIYPEYVIFADQGRYNFYEITDELPPLGINQDSLVSAEKGEMQYVLNGETVSHKGIDVSKFQGKIDWQKVHEDGVEYAMIRLGIRGYGTGAIVIDDTFESNIKGALDNEVEVGVYFYTQAITKDEAIEEANTVIQAIKDYNVTYPVVLDIEDPNDSEARTANLTPQERTDIAIAFLEKIKEAGYKPMIYGNLKSYFGMLEINRLKDYDLWFAYYDSSIYFPYKIKMWQYTESGSVNGINGNVDLNITFE